MKPHGPPAAEIERIADVGRLLRAEVLLEDEAAVVERPVRVRSAGQFDDRLLAATGRFHPEFDLMGRPALERGIHRGPLVGLDLLPFAGFVSAIVILGHESGRGDQIAGLQAGLGRGRIRLNGIDHRLDPVGQSQAGQGFGRVGKRDDFPFVAIGVFVGQFQFDRVLLLEFHRAQHDQLHLPLTGIASAQRFTSSGSRTGSSLRTVTLGLSALISPEANQVSWPSASGSFTTLISSPAAAGDSVRALTPAFSAGPPTRASGHLAHAHSQAQIGTKLRLHGDFNRVGRGGIVLPNDAEDNRLAGQLLHAIVVVVDIALVRILRVGFERRHLGRIARIGHAHDPVAALEAAVFRGLGNRAAGNERVEALLLDGKESGAIGGRDADLREARALVLERVDAVGVLPSLHVDLDFLVLLGAHHDRADVVEERLLAAVDPG